MMASLRVRIWATCFAPYLAVAIWPSCRRASSGSRPSIPPPAHQSAALGAANPYRGRTVLRRERASASKLLSGPQRQACALPLACTLIGCDFRPHIAHTALSETVNRCKSQLWLFAAQRQCNPLTCNVTRSPKAGVAGSNPAGGTGQAWYADHL